MIIAYLKEFEHNFYVMPKNILEHAYPCPRTWNFASDLIYMGLEKDIAAAIGEAIAGDFITYYALKDDLPDWDKIGNKDYKWDGKENLSAAYAATFTAVTKATPKNFRSLLNFLYNSINKEYAYLFATSVKDSLVSEGFGNDIDLEFADLIVSSTFPDGTTVFDEKLSSIKDKSAINNLF